MDLLVNQLKIAIRELLERKGVRARVLDKINAHGERTIGVILAKDQSGDQSQNQAHDPGGASR